MFFCGGFRLRQLLRCRNHLIGRKIKSKLIGERGQKWYRSYRLVNSSKEAGADNSNRLKRSARSERLARVHAFEECGNLSLGYHRNRRFVVQPVTRQNIHACIRDFARRFSLEKIIFAKSFALSHRDRMIMARTGKIPCRREAIELAIAIGLLGFTPGYIKRLLEQKFTTITGLNYRLNLCLGVVRAKTHGLCRLVFSHQIDLLTSRIGEREGFLRVVVRKLDYQRLVPQFAREEAVTSLLPPFGENRKAH